MTSLQTLKSRMPAFSWARVVSDIVSPPIVWAVIVLPVAIQYAPEQALFWAVLYSIPICLLPIIYIALMVWQGKIGDIHMKERRERYRPLLVSIVCTGFALWLLRLLNAPNIFPLLALISLVQISVIALITLAWQISMHAMSISSAMVAVGIIFSLSVAILLLPLVVLVGTARLRLQRHTPAQVIAGILVGALVPLLVLVALYSTL